MTNTSLGLAPTLLVFGDPCRLLEVDAQIFRTRFDDTRNHSLFDNGVAAWPEACAQKEIGDIATPAAGVIQKIDRLSVPANAAFDRYLGITDILTTCAAIAVIKNQFDRSCTDGFATAGTVKDNVSHRFAAQHLGRTLAHHPAHGIDDVRLAATIGPHHGHQVCREIGHGWIDKGFESCEFYFIESHRGARILKSRDYVY